MIDFDLRAEKRADDFADNVHDRKLENDFDYFLNYHSNEIEEMKESIEKVKDLYRLYNYDFDLNDLIG